MVHGAVTQVDKDEIKGDRGGYEIRELSGVVKHTGQKTLVQCFRGQNKERSHMYEALCGVGRLGDVVEVRLQGKELGEK